MSPARCKVCVQAPRPEGGYALPEEVWASVLPVDRRKVLIRVPRCVHPQEGWQVINYGRAYYVAEVLDYSPSEWELRCWRLGD